MSARPRHGGAPAAGSRVTTSDLAEMKRAGEAIVMVTAYDYPGALAAEEAGVDVVLVGDSAAMTVLGYASTTEVSVDEMLMLTAAVRRGLGAPMLVGDLPFGSYEDSDEQAVADGAPLRRRGGLRRGEAGGRRGGVGVAGSGDCRGGDPSHGARRVDSRRPRRSWADSRPRAGPRTVLDGWPRKRSRCRRPAASRSCSRPSQPRWPRRSCPRWTPS